MVLGLPAMVSAQWGGGQYDPYGRNGGYNNGQYGDLRSTVKNLKNRTKELRKQIDRDLERSRWNDRNREDRINDIAKRFKDAVDDINKDGRDQRDVGRAIDAGTQLDRALARTRLSYQVQNLWSSVQYDLQVLGNANGYYNNNRNNRNRFPRTGTGRNLPSWWPF